jgi:hypothetical protein
MSLGLNVARISTRLIQKLNKNDTITLLSWTGQSVDSSGDPIPTYVTTTGISAQIQPVDTQELKHKNYYNDNTIYKRFYFVNNNVIQGLNRQIQTAGDYILWNGFTYKIVEYLENFESGWINVIGAQGIDEITP